ncbi:MAG: hypothetical protein JWP87_3192, partial [Labilithrix sp.]|nr:hypothetical protein [Labilithrix sp.]
MSSAAETPAPAGSVSAGPATNSGRAGGRNPNKSYSATTEQGNTDR